MPDLSELVHTIEALLFLTTVLLFARKIELGDGPVSNAVGPSLLGLRHYNVLPACFVAVMAVFLAVVRSDYSLFGEVVLLCLTLSMLLMISLTEHEDDKLFARLSGAALFFALTGCGLSFYELYRAGCLL